MLASVSTSLATSDADALGQSVQSALAWVEQALIFLRESPWTPTAGAAIALGVGLCLWFAGARIARPAMIMACAVVGAVGVGSLAGTMEASPMWLWSIGGLVVGAVAGMIIFRLAVAGVIAVVVGLAAPAAAAVIQNIDLIPEHTQKETTGEALFLDGVPMEGETIAAVATGDSETMTGAIVHRASGFADAVADEAGQAWRALPERDRLILSGSALGGALLGLAIGLFWPGASAAAVTSALGAAMWLPAGFVLLQRSSGVPEWMPSGGMSALGLWLGVTIAGAMIQTAMSTRRRAKTKIVHVHHQDQPAAA